MKKRTGYLFRRADGKHIPIDDPKHQDARIYLCYMVNYERKTVALGTADKRTAEIKAAKLMGGMAFSGHENYLLHLIEMGELARRELAGEHDKRLQTPIKEVWDNYVASKERPASGDKTLTQYKSTWTRFTGSLPVRVEHIEDVTKKMCESYIDDLERNFKKTTCEKHIVQLKVIFRTISTRPSPWERLRTIKADDQETHRGLSIDECRRLYKHATGQMKLLILIGYSTGLRLKDCVSLRWSQVNMKTRIMKVAPYKNIKKKPEPLHIPITDNLYRQLAAVKRDNNSPYVLPAVLAAYTKREGTLISRIGRIFDKAKVFDTDEGKASFHSLRVTFQSLNDNAGTSRVITRSITGHSSARMSDHYSRLDVDNAREALERAIPAL